MQLSHNNKRVRSLVPLLGIGVAGGAVAAVAAASFLGSGFLVALLVYSLVGAAFTLFAAWRHFRCLERQEQQEKLMTAR